MGRNGAINMTTATVDKEGVTILFDDDDEIQFVLQLMRGSK